LADPVDPRIERTKRHTLREVITIALCGEIGGAERWVEVDEWGDAKRAWLPTGLAVPNGVPSHDTFGRVFSRIDPAQFDAGCLHWVQGVVTIDGKTIRAARERGSNPWQVV